MKLFIALLIGCFFGLFSGARTKPSPRRTSRGRSRKGGISDAAMRGVANGIKAGLSGKR